MELYFQKIEKEMPIPDENIKQISCTLPITKSNTNDYSSHK